GNVTKVTWSGAVYDNQRLLLGYHEVTLDARGQTSTKDWFNAQYDGDKQVTRFTEIDHDALGNTTTRQWSGGTYVANPAYSQDLARQGVAQDAPQFLLVGYHEQDTDQNGVTTLRDWNGAAYDRYGQ